MKQENNYVKNGEGTFKQYASKWIGRAAVLGCLGLAGLGIYKVANKEQPKKKSVYEKMIEHIWNMRENCTERPLTKADGEAYMEYTLEALAECEKEFGHTQTKIPDSTAEKITKYLEEHLKRTGAKLTIITR